MLPPTPPGCRSPCRVSEQVCVRGTGLFSCLGALPFLDCSHDLAAPSLKIRMPKTPCVLLVNAFRGSLNGVVVNRSIALLGVGGDRGDIQGPWDVSLCLCVPRSSPGMPGHPGRGH